jgi:hypothetical protein
VLSTLSARNEIARQMNNVLSLPNRLAQFVEHDLDRYRFTDGRSLLSMFIIHVARVVGFA